MTSTFSAIITSDLEHVVGGARPSGDNGGSGKVDGGAAHPGKVDGGAGSPPKRGGDSGNGGGSGDQGHGFDFHINGGVNWH